MAGESAQLHASAPAGSPSSTRTAARIAAASEADGSAQTPAPPDASTSLLGNPADGTTGAREPVWSSWSNLWQVPAIAISLALIVAAVRTTIQPAAANDFEGVYRQIDQLIAASQFETARSLLKDIIEPNLGAASQSERARFHATVADLLFCSQKADRAESSQGHQRVADQYSQARELEFELSLTRIERWAIASLGLGQLADARKRLTELDSMAIGHDPADSAVIAQITTTRNRIFRKLVDATLRRAEASTEEVAQMVSDYRAGTELSAEDEVWSIARLAELRLAEGKAQDVVQMLLVEMRRLESRGHDQSAANLGELYTLLGRAYFDLGDTERSTAHLEMAMQLLSDTEPAYGDALVVSARIAMSQDDPDTALEKFNVVVRDFVGTPSYLAGLLGHAEASSVVGDHEQARADYQTLREALSHSGPRRDVTDLLAAQSLCDRHDAALAQGHLERAAEYAALAESYFKAEEVPLEVLIRLASTHRQIGDNTLAQARSVPAAEQDPQSAQASALAIATSANEHFLQAGEFYLRHANSHDAARLGDREWATSLWLAADSFDRGGRVDQAIRYFLRYLDSSSMDDQRRAETLFRLGQAYQAQMNFEQAIEFYEQLVADHARSSYAADAHVPMSRCYVALDRRPEAEQQLREVLSGARLLTPDAEDYRDALIELGTLHYNAHEYSSAIERLTEALERYPQDVRRLEMMYRLADSYRDSAMILGDRLKEPPPLPPSEQGRINVQRAEQLQRALDLFAQICESFATETVPSASLAVAGPLEQDMLRRSHLYRSDCAFHLGFYEQAIELYDRSARLYSTHASSMYALVQIVNCYNLLNDSERAGAAHRRALVRLKQLPDTAFDSPESLMDRAAWERWLDHSPVGATLSSANTG